ncbi:biotin transporter BioY [Schaalia sp. 19OD2882]|uniref:biotin transporter BioY n=1 Tax=Schaalia sp. 19OD2882 TaxID=2794089 RepID=UPI001C1EF1FD|nr:biotin transporter BioY [Schaalia sp. 19OD2882]QWW19413.1 biotin transporter BioY [Schaalia sp. 19OD2882]
MSATTRTLAPVLADRLVGSATIAKDVALVLTGAAVVGALAQVSVPMWPVSITGQTLGVLVVGATLGARRGALSMLSYMGLGLAGVPWFADFTGGPHTILKPSFGFIVGFVAAAWVIGALAERRWDRSTWTSLAAFGIATAIPFAVGVPWMWAILHFLMGRTMGLAATLQAGLVPFIPGGVIKGLLGFAIVTGAWRLLDGMGRRSL